MARILEEFGSTQYLTRKVKELVKERGIFCSGNPKQGKPQPQERVNRVISFFHDPGVSREISGVKDYVSVNDNGKRTHKQKGLI